MTNPLETSALRTDAWEPAFCWRSLAAMRSLGNCCSAPPFAACLPHASSPLSLERYSWFLSRCLPEYTAIWLTLTPPIHLISQTGKLALLNLRPSVWAPRNSA